MQNGEKMRVVEGAHLPRKKWPLQENGEPYEKIQHLAQDFHLCTTRDYPDKPHVYIVLAK
jgi:hypothetical protein